MKLDKLFIRFNFQLRHRFSNQSLFWIPKSKISQKPKTWTQGFGSIQTRFQDNDYEIIITLLVNCYFLYHKSSFDVSRVISFGFEIKNVYVFGL